jgi:hypothetical protein
MNSAKCERLRQRWYELEAQIADIHEGKTVNGDPAATEAVVFAATAPASTVRGSIRQCGRCGAVPCRSVS